MDLEAVAKSDQEQAVAAWVSYLNQVRIDRMLAEFAQQELDLERAVAEMAKAIQGIDVLILKNNGGDKGLHGKIAEVAEVGVRNARELVQGRVGAYSLPRKDNGPVDVWRDEQGLQLKFYETGGDFSLSAVRKHLEKYEWFLEMGNKYVIPRDQYDSVMELYHMSEQEASRLVGSDNGLSYKQWKRVQAFFKETGMTPDDLEGAAFDYADVQKATIYDSMEAESEALHDVHDARHDESYERFKPTLKEGAKATAAAAAIEGVATFVMAIASRLKNGRRLRDLDENDWIEIAGESGKGFVKGGIRGASVYFVTSFNVSGYVSETYSLATHEFVEKATENYISMSGAAASALVTASFGVAEQAHRFRAGSIDEAEFLERSELLCLDASVSALSSFVGQTVIPLPVLGAIIGNTVGNVLYQTAKDGLSTREQALAQSYIEEQHRLDAALDARYQMLVAEYSEAIQEYLLLLDRALSPDPSEAFEGSISLAKSLGVLEEELLTSMDEIDDFFLL